MLSIGRCRSMRRYLGFFLCSLLPLGASLLEAQSQQRSDAAGPYEAENGNITMALTGDSIITRPLTSFQEPQFLALRKVLLAQDVRFSNSEVVYTNYDNWPTVLGQGMWMRSDPPLISNMQWLGFNIVSCANNHAGDFGQGGILTNIKNLDQAGLVHAGTGSNYAEATAPAYLETAKGRVALISATSSGEPGIRAGKQRRDMVGSPGVNFIRWVNEWTVDADAFASLKRVAQAFHWDQSPGPRMEHDYGLSKEDVAKTIWFEDRNVTDRPFTTKNMQMFEDPPAGFVQGSGFAVHTFANQNDVEANLSRVREARRSADWVIFSIHNHEGGKTDELPSDHVVALAHAAIDNGADVVAGHGPHVTRGIEIYKGKPIFYSLGNFLSENESLSLLPEQMFEFYGLGNEDSTADIYGNKRGSTSTVNTYESYFAVAEFRHKELTTIKIYPIDLGFGQPRYEAGRPVLAQGDIARRILERVQRLSEPFGTKILIEDDIGIIQIK